MKVTLSCPILCDPKEDSFVCRILWARILEWVAIPFSRGSSCPRDWTQVSCIAGGFFTVWATREAQLCNQRSHHATSRESPLAAAKTQSSQKKKHVLHTHTHTHTHTRKGFNACLSIPIHYQKPWFYAVKFILGTWTSGRELWQSQPHVSREAGHVASAQACLEEMVSSFLLLVEATLPNATRTLHF